MVLSGCTQAKVKESTPYDLGRTMATGTREIPGKEAATLLLGHTKTDTINIYLLEEPQESALLQIAMAKQYLHPTGSLR